MTTLVAPGPTRPLPARLQRFGSAEDMRKEPSLHSPEGAQSSSTPGPTPQPVRPSAALPNGSLASLQSICLAIVQQGILNASYKRLELPPDVLSELAARLQAKGLLSDDNVALFASLPEIHMDNCPISDKGIRSLLENPDSHSLAALHLENTNITDASLRLLAQRTPKLRVLDLSKCSQVSDKGLGAITEHCLELRYLGMRDVFALNDAVVASALQLPHLIRLDLDGACRLSDGLCKRLTLPGRMSLFSYAKKPAHNAPPKISNLEELSLASTSLSPSVLPIVTSLCPRLHTLNLSFCQQVSDHVLSDILDHTPLLQNLTLKATPAVSDASLALLHRLQVLFLLDNPQLSLPAIRRLVTSESGAVKVYGQETDVTLIRNSLSLQAFTITVNEFDSAHSLLAHINANLASETCATEQEVCNSYKLRRVTYRKNGTKRPGTVHADSEYSHLVRELLEKKHHIYLDQNPNSVIRQPGAPQTNDLFLTLRVWDRANQKPKDLRDVSLPSTMTLSELKQHLANDGVLPTAPENMFLVEEETDLRTNILAVDSMSISMCGIISGDILHLEEIAPEKLDSSNQVIRSWTGDYLSRKPTTISIQETDDSFHRRRGRLTFLPDASFKFELKLKSTWSFAKLKSRIARKLGVAAEYLRIATRVEPQIHLQGSTQPAVEIIGGNLWLLLEIDSAEMLAEKIPVVIHNFGRNSICTGVQTVLVRRTATIKGLKEKIAEVTSIPEETMLISRLSSKDLATSSDAPTFVRQVYTQNSAKLSQLGLHHVRVDEMERPVLESDLVLQTVQFQRWKSSTFKTVATAAGPVRLIAIPLGSKFNEVKAAVSSTSTPSALDMDTLTLKLAGSCSLSRDLMFDIKPRYFAENSTVVAATLMRPLDIICWSPSSF